MEHLGALDVVYQGVIRDHRALAVEVDEVDPLVDELAATRSLLVGAPLALVTDAAAVAVAGADVEQALVAAVPVIVVSGATSKVVASRNMIVDNGSFGFSNNAAVFESTGDNVLRNNNGGGVQTNGAITVVGGA